MAQKPDPRYEDLRERYADQVAPVSKIRMLRCDCCARTFFDFDGRPAEKAPGKHRCGAQLRWVWVE